MVLEKLAENYGIHANAELALERASRYAKRCATMGGSWVSYEEWSESWMVFAVRHTCKERFEEAWTLCEKWEQDAVEADAVEKEPALNNSSNQAVSGRDLARIHMDLYAACCRNLMTLGLVFADHLQN